MSHLEYVALRASTLTGDPTTSKGFGRRLGDPVRKAVRAADLDLAEGLAVDVHHSKALARRLIDRDAPKVELDIDAHAVSVLSNDLLPGWYDDWAVIAAEGWLSAPVACA